MFYKANCVIKIDNHVIEASIKVEQNTRTFEATGVDNLRNFYLGNVVNSNQPEYWLLPSEIENGTKAVITIDDTVQGDFIFQNIHRSRFKQIEKMFGQTFKGVFIPRKTYNPDEWQ